MKCLGIGRVVQAWRYTLGLLTPAGRASTTRPARSTRSTPSASSGSSGARSSPAGASCAATPGATAASTSGPDALPLPPRSGARDRRRHLLTPLENLLTGVLEWFHETVGLTWAWSIVALVVSCGILLVPVTVRQIHSMQNLQVHAPEMKEIQQRWKHDRQRQNEELMKFYRENKINPAASCLPIVFQIPIFIALFFVLRDFEEEIFPQYPSRASSGSASWTSRSRQSTAGGRCCSSSTSPAS